MRSRSIGCHKEVTLSDCGRKSGINIGSTASQALQKNRPASAGRKTCGETERVESEFVFELNAESIAYVRGIIDACLADQVGSVVL